MGVRFERRNSPDGNRSERQWSNRRGGSEREARNGGSTVSEGIDGSDSFVGSASVTGLQDPFTPGQGTSQMVSQSGVV